MISAIGISFIYKTKRIEVSVLCFLILGTLLFYSSPINHPSYDEAVLQTVGTQERYMLSNLVLLSMIFSFVMIKVYEINFNKISISKERFISKGFKIIFLLILGLLLFVSFFYSTPMLDIRESTFVIRDLRPFVVGFPIDSELPEKSIVIGIGRAVIFYDKIPFDIDFVKNKKFDSSEIDDNHIILLIDRMDEGYTVYTPKDARSEQPKFFRYLEVEHGLILKDFSNIFCKMERLTIDVNPDTKSDDVCYTFQGIVVPKLE